MDTGFRELENKIVEIQTDYKHTVKDIEDIKSMIIKLVEDDSFKLQIANIQTTLDNINRHTDPQNHKQQTIDDVLSYLNTNNGIEFIARIASGDERFKKIREKEIKDQTKDNKLGIYDRLTTIVITLVVGVITSYVMFFVKGN